MIKTEGEVDYHGRCAVAITPCVIDTCAVGCRLQAVFTLSPMFLVRYSSLGIAQRAEAPAGVPDLSCPRVQGIMCLIPVCERPQEQNRIASRRLCAEIRDIAGGCSYLYDRARDGLWDSLCGRKTWDDGLWNRRTWSRACKRESRRKIHAKPHTENNARHTAFTSGQSQAGQSAGKCGVLYEQWLYTCSHRHPPSI